MIVFRRYESDRLPGMVSIWNQVFAGGPNFAALTEQDFLARVVSQPSFDPKGLILAMRGDDVAGFVHFGPVTNFWFKLSEREVKQSVGQVWALVAPAADRQLMQALLDAAVADLAAAGARHVLFYPSWVQCTQPFYNGIAGAYEMPGLAESRVEMLDLLTEQGFTYIAHYATPELELSEMRHLALLREEAARVLSRVDCAQMETRVREIASQFFPPRRVVELLEEKEPIAMTAFGLWEEYAREYKRKLYGITGVQVASAWRGRGLGKAIMVLAMDAALKEGAEALHLHVYRKNRPAWNLYHRALGFQPRHSWVTLTKQL